MALACFWNTGVVPGSPSSETGRRPTPPHLPYPIRCHMWNGEVMGRGLVPAMLLCGMLDYRGFSCWGSSVRVDHVVLLFIELGHRLLLLFQSCCFQNQLRRRHRLGTNPEMTVSGVCSGIPSSYMEKRQPAAARSSACMSVRPPCLSGAVSQRTFW